MPELLMELGADEGVAKRVGVGIEVHSDRLTGRWDRPRRLMMMNSCLLSFIPRGNSPAPDDLKGPAFFGACFPSISGEAEGDIPATWNSLGQAFLFPGVGQLFLLNANMIERFVFVRYLRVQYSTLAQSAVPYKILLLLDLRHHVSILIFDELLTYQYLDNWRSHLAA
jgi:hypothetical protein